MAIRFLRQPGIVQSVPIILRVDASGTIHPGSVVEFQRGTTTNLNKVFPAGANTTFTSIFGISLDYIEGSSGAKVRVVPFMPGQYWEVDCANAPNTNQLFLRHALSDNRSVNNTNTNVNAATGVFMAYSISGTVFASSSTGTFRLIGEFLRSPASYSL